MHNARARIILLAVAPLACLLSVEVNVIISARVNDVRTAQQLGGLMVLPFGAIYVAGEIGMRKRALYRWKPTICLSFPPFSYLLMQFYFS